MSTEISQPMLAGRCADVSKLKFPILCSQKLDGIRCLKLGGKALTRSFKPVPNKFIREYIEANLPDGLDGELIVKGKEFSDVSGEIRNGEGQPNFTFAVFDYVREEIEIAYYRRMCDLRELPNYARVEKILPVRINNVAELDAYEVKCLAEGYEGVMVRSPNSPYKCGRSTEGEGYLLKIKRFEDDEAEVVGFEELMHNDNIVIPDAFGRAKRSSHAGNKRGSGTLGCLLVKFKGQTFGIGTGYTALQRGQYWGIRHTLIGKLVKFRHQPSGAKDLPRFPSFIGFRETFDL